jgi:hypothetical protein
MTRAILDTSVVISSGDDEAVLRALPAEAAISVATLADGVSLFTRNPTDFAGLASLIDVRAI